MDRLAPMTTDQRTADLLDLVPGNPFRRPSLGWLMSEHGRLPIQRAAIGMSSAAMPMVFADRTGVTDRIWGKEYRRHPRFRSTPEALMKRRKFPVFAKLVTCVVSVAPSRLGTATIVGTAGSLAIFVAPGWH